MSEERIEACFCCDGVASAFDGGHGEYENEWQVECDECRYRIGDFASEAEAIAGHNAIARKVREHDDAIRDRDEMAEAAELSRVAAEAEAEHADKLQAKLDAMEAKHNE